MPPSIASLLEEQHRTLSLLSHLLLITLPESLETKSQTPVERLSERELPLERERLCYHVVCSERQRSLFPNDVGERLRAPVESLADEARRA